jgi:hypothetical protein
LFHEISLKSDETTIRKLMILESTCGRGWEWRLSKPVRGDFPMTQSRKLVFSFGEALNDIRI